VFDLPSLEVKDGDVLVKKKDINKVAKLAAQPKSD
jgi:hypothetical protein